MIWQHHWFQCYLEELPGVVRTGAQIFPLLSGHNSITSVSWTKALWAWLRQLTVEAQTSWEGRWRSTPAWHRAEWSTSCLFLACVGTEFFVSADRPSCGRCTCWFSAMNIWDFGDTVMQCDFMNTPNPHEVSPVKINNPLPGTGTCTLA